MKLISTKTYERAIRKLIPMESRKKLEDSIAEDPTLAPVISGTGGIRKLRWSVPGRGKRGGIRMIYFYHARPEEIYLLMAYGKSTQEDLTPADKKVLSKLVATIKKESK
jgi:hypothetical protein